MNAKFPIRVKNPLIPPSYINGTHDTYINELCFSKAGERYTYRDIIHLVADKKGAHLDDTEKPFHKFEKAIFLPIGNPKREGVFPLATRYLIDIAQTSLKVLPNYLKEIELFLSNRSEKR